MIYKNLIDMVFDKSKSCDIHVFNSYLCIDSIGETKYTRVYLTWFNVSFAWVNCPGTFPAHFLVTLVLTPSPAWRLLIESVCWLNKPPAVNACDYYKVSRFSSGLWLKVACNLNQATHKYFQSSIEVLLLHLWFSILQSFCDLVTVGMCFSLRPGQT